MIVRVLGSGSKGNAVVIEAGQTRVLVDAGFSPRGMEKRLEFVEVAPASIEAVIVTHEHGDHVKGVAAGAKRWGWRILATAGTRTGCASLARASVETISARGRFTIGDLDITTIGTSHDANEPMAVVATSRETGARAAIVYDLGVCTNAVMRAVSDVEILMIEANHDLEMLRRGPYPPVLQNRIRSRYGHLSNDDAAAVARKCAHKGLSHIVLAHLSQKNNRPRIALETVRAALDGTEFSGQLTAASQGRPTGPFAVAGARAPGQLELTL
ncbi:MAG TPA: MBL fold metallo-hydrolase [Rhodothermia bacterium]|nr:MBL fold metallo-hydrolase [Rhodothermia bacterium]